MVRLSSKSTTRANRCPLWLPRSHHPPPRSYRRLYSSRPHSQTSTSGSGWWMATPPGYAWVWQHGTTSRRSTWSTTNACGSWRTSTTRMDRARTTTASTWLWPTTRIDWRTTPKPTTTHAQFLRHGSLSRPGPYPLQLRKPKLRTLTPHPQRTQSATRRPTHPIQESSLRMGNDNGRPHIRLTSTRTKRSLRTFTRRHLPTTSTGRPAPRTRWKHDTLRPSHPPQKLRHIHPMGPRLSLQNHPPEIPSWHATSRANGRRSLRLRHSTLLHAHRPYMGERQYTCYI